MEDTIFVVALASVVLAATYVLLTRGRRHIEEWEHDFFTRDSGGAGTPYQPIPTRHRKYYCGDCKLAFLFVEYLEGPTMEPICPFCHSKRTSEATPDTEVADSTLREPISQPTTVKERERAAKNEEREVTAAKTVVATPPEDNDPWNWWPPLN